MTEQSLVLVTQAAAYRDGPAGVHGVLGQSAIAMAQLADVAGMSFYAVADVRSLAAEDLVHARVVALFAIGETPWDDDQRAALLSGVRSGATGVVAIHAATDSCYGWVEYRKLVGARFNGHPWTQDVDLEVCEPSHPALATWGRGGGGTTISTSSVSCGATPGCCCGWTRDSSTWGARGCAVPTSPSRWRGASPREKAASSPPPSGTSRRRGRRDVPAPPGRRAGVGHR